MSKPFLLAACFSIALANAAYAGTLPAASGSIEITDRGQTFVYVCENMAYTISADQVEEDKGSSGDAKDNAYISCDTVPDQNIPKLYDALKAGRRLEKAIARFTDEHKITYEIELMKVMVSNFNMALRNADTAPIYVNLNFMGVGGRMTFPSK
ncbi:MAG TPA: hypothetical protein VKT70_14020 [Stellaceae bacterium]|nr:hypothetical protein [Stellaceae bacterium]